MHTASLAFVAATGLAAPALADFAIWTSDLATAGAPEGPISSALFVPYLDSGIACGDLDGNPIRYAYYNDVNPQQGGVSCDGCESGSEFERFEYWDGPTDNGNAIMSQTFGYVTLRPIECSEDWSFEYVTPDRDGGGVITNSRCVRAEGDFTCSIAVATRTGAKLFDCFTSIEVIPSE